MKFTFKNKHEIHNYALMNYKSMAKKKKKLQVCELMYPIACNQRVKDTLIDYFFFFFNMRSKI